MQIMLSEVMGFRVRYQEFQGGAAVTVPRLKAQNVVDIAMELWATPENSWHSFGNLGYQGRSGLYVPSRFVEANPELSIDFWRFMQSPAARNLFVKSGKGPEMRAADGGYICDNIYKGCQKGRYFPAWYKEEEAHNFVEIWIPFPGWSHEDIVASYIRNKTAPGIIFYTWIPTTFVASNNVTRLMLPFDASGAFNKHMRDPQNTVLTVDEPQFSLLKGGTSKFPQEFPDAAEFLNKFEIQDDEVNLMLLEIANNISYTDAACNWLRNNEARWSAWIPPPPKTFDKCPTGTGRYLLDGLGICLTCPSESFNW
ncbi:hypothetical protein BC829DRAFT_214698 [Chytridium lagenaria]|nr:hypothetical protein BC829DRAFT_214698 [Chytridium lagenaria]